MQIRIHPDDISCISIPRYNQFVYDVASKALLLGDGERTVDELLKGVPHVHHGKVEPTPDEETKEIAVSDVEEAIAKFKTGDVNEDGVVDEEDLSIVHTQYAEEKKKKAPKKAPKKKKGK